MARLTPGKIEAGWTYGLRAALRCAFRVDIQIGELRAKVLTVSNQVISCRDAGWNRAGPTTVLLGIHLVARFTKECVGTYRNHLALSPVAISDRPGEQSRLVNLEL